MALTITKVECNETRTGIPRWVVTFSDGLVVSTLRPQVGNTATMLWNNGTEVVRETVTKGPWTNLERVAPVPRSERQAPAAPVEDEDSDPLF